METKTTQAKRFYSVKWFDNGTPQEQTVIGQSAAIAIKKFVKKTVKGATHIRFQHCFDRNGSRLV